MEIFFINTYIFMWIKNRRLVDIKMLIQLLDKGYPQINPQKS